MNRRPKSPGEKVIISGAGISQTGRGLGRPDIDLAAEASSLGVSDAGSSLDDIDGLVTWPGEVLSTPGMTGPAIARTRDALNLHLQWHAALSEGPGQAAAVMQAMMAIATRVVRHVLVYRTAAEASAHAGGFRGASNWDAGGITSPEQWLRPFGSVTPAIWFAPQFARYIRQYGITKEQVGWLAVTRRAHAVARGTSVYPDALAIAGYLESRFVATLVQLDDCDVPADGSVAFVVSAADQVSGSPNPVRFAAPGSRMFLGALGSAERSDSACAVRPAPSRNAAPESRLAALCRSIRPAGNSRMAGSMAAATCGRHACRSEDRLAPPKDKAPRSLSWRSEAARIAGAFLLTGP
jgi:acetyl-CoA acetyltransferase